MKTKEITLVALMLAMLIICSQIAIPIGVVPITLQTFAVLLLGLILRPRLAVLTTFLYAGMGLVGLPVFSGASGGPQMIMAPSFGFILGFIPSAWIVSVMSRQTKHSQLIHNIFACLAGTIMTFVFGVIYFIIIMNGIRQMNMSTLEILGLTVIPFIPGAILKMVLALSVHRVLKPVTMKFFEGVKN